MRVGTKRTLCKQTHNCYESSRVDATVMELVQYAHRSTVSTMHGSYIHWCNARGAIRVGGPDMQTVRKGHVRPWLAVSQMDPNNEGNRFSANLELYHQPIQGLPP